jgi:CHASE2 domain-containing sensor protein
MTESLKHGSFWPYLFRGAVVVFIAVLITGILHGTWFIQQWELTNLDSLHALRGPQQVSQIYIVGITDDDFSREFGDKSPLDWKRIGAILQAISSGGARVIGVDVLTEDWPSEEVRRLKIDTPIVWARLIEDDSAAEVTLRPVLGSDGEGFETGPTTLEEINGVVRNYTPEPIIAGRGPVPSFTTLVSKHYLQITHGIQGRSDLSGGSVSGEHKPIPISFVANAKSFRYVSAGALLAASNQPQWSKNQLFQGKIVLLGGMFDASRDRYKTPLQEPMYGVQILAVTIASEILDKKLTEASWAIFLLLDAAVGLTLVALAYFVPRPWSLLAACSPLVVIGTASLFVFQLFSYYISTMPLLLGVFVHALLENTHEYRVLKKRNVYLSKEIERLRKPLATTSFEDTTNK